MMENLKTACTMAREHTPFPMAAPTKVNFTRTGIHERKKKKTLPFCSFSTFLIKIFGICCLTLLLCKHNNGCFHLYVVQCY